MSITLQEFIERVKIFLVCVVDQLSDHLFWYTLVWSKKENFWTPSTNRQSLYLYTTGKFSAISCTDFAISCNRKLNYP